MLSGPLVRSSYRAGRLYQQAMDARVALTSSRARCRQLAYPVPMATKSRRRQAAETDPRREEGRPRAGKRAVPRDVADAGPGVQHDPQGGRRFLPLFIIAVVVSAAVVYVVVCCSRSMLDRRSRSRCAWRSRPACSIFNRRAQKMTFAQADGTPGRGGLGAAEPAAR